MIEARTVDQRIELPGEVERLGATLSMPVRPRGVVIFAHGSGSSRFSPRNRYVADQLVDRGFATLLTDLLTAGEERIDRITAHYRFDVGLLARRLVAATLFAERACGSDALAFGYFGASTGAAAALIAAAQRPQSISAVVSRGGRPDLAGDALARVRAPTLLIVGGNDPEVLALNRGAAAALGCRNEVAIVPGATHLFEEAGALERVAELAGRWFDEFLA